MTRRSEVIDVDMGFDRIMAAIPELRGATVDIGIQEDAGVAEDGTTVAEYAFYNEFGTENIPARPFMRGTADEQRNRWYNFAERSLNLVIEGKLGLTPALNMIGERAADDTRQYAVKLSTPPNADSTIAAKGSSNPLVDTGRMVQSIRHVVKR